MLSEALSSGNDTRFYCNAGALSTTNSEVN